MDTTAALQAYLNDTIRHSSEALADPRELDLEAVEQMIHTLKRLSRETFQAMFRDTYDLIASRLDGGVGLQAKDREAIELLFTGEEAAYLGANNNYNHGIQELRRLVAELQQVGNAGTDSVDSLMRLQGLCQSAAHLLPEVLFHVRERERIQRLRENLNQDLRGHNGHLVAGMIRDLMISPDR